MRVSFHDAPSHPLLGVLENSQVRVGLLTAAALLVEVLLIEYVLDVNPSMFVLLGPLWVFSVYKVSNRRDRTTEIAASVAVVLVTAAVLLAAWL